MHLYPKDNHSSTSLRWCMGERTTQLITCILETNEKVVLMRLKGLCDKRICEKSYEFLIKFVLSHHQVILDINFEEKTIYHP
jgi:hypothetical protein